MNILSNQYIFLVSLLIFFSCNDVFDSEVIYGCTDKDACNYNENATELWDGSCNYAVGACNCDNEPINEDECDCEGNILDDCGICGGDGVDVDGDGICDDIDFCIGEYDNGYYCSDLDVLYDFKINNIGSYLDTISVVEIIDLHSSVDDSGRLTYLSLPGKNIHTIPSSAYQLDSLKTLFLNDNQITYLDTMICNLSKLSDFYIYDNQLCDQYKFDCINWGINDDHWQPQECNGDE